MTMNDDTEIVQLLYLKLSAEQGVCIKRGHEICKLGKRVGNQRKHIRRLEADLNVLRQSARMHHLLQHEVLSARQQIESGIATIKALKAENEAIKSRNSELEILHHFTEGVNKDVFTGPDNGAGQ